MFLTCLAQKGGMNKTTASVNLAAQWAAKGRPGIVVDLDRQQHHAMLYAGSIPGVTFTNQWPPVIPDGGFVIVDCSPHITQTLGPALLASDLVLIPSIPTGLALEGVDQTAATVQMYRQQKPDLAALVFFSSVDKLKMTGRIIDRYTQERSIWPVAKSRIGRRPADFERAFEKRSPVALASRAWADYRALANEIEECFA